MGRAVAPPRARLSLSLARDLSRVSHPSIDLPQIRLRGSGDNARERASSRCTPRKKTQSHRSCGLAPDATDRGPRACTYTRNGPHLSHLISIEPPLDEGKTHLAKTKRNLAVGSRPRRRRLLCSIRVASGSNLRFPLLLSSVFLYISSFYFSCRPSFSLSLSLFLRALPTRRQIITVRLRRRAAARIPGLDSPTRARHDIRAGCTQDLYFADRSTNEPTGRKQPFCARGSSPDFKEKCADGTMFTAGP